MTFKQFKRILAQFLIVAFMIPNLNAMAATKEVKTVVENEGTSEQATTEEKVSEDINSEDVNSESKNENVNEEEKTDSINKEELNNKEESSNEEELNNNEESINKEDSINEDNVIENDKKEDATIESENYNDTSKEVESKTQNIEEEKAVEENQEDSTDSLKGKTYEKIKVVNSKARSSIAMFSLDEEEEEREEFRLKQEAINNLEVLVPMTDSEYELTIANADGSFEFLDSYDDINSAVSAANNISAYSLEETQQPAVINARGQVVYSTNQMARILKYVSNQNVTGNVTVYSDSALTKSLVVINQGFLDDVPILDVNGNSTKIMVNGLEGWINNNKQSGTYDMIVVPLNQAKNPSYYTVRNGELVHFVSYDLTGTTGYEKILGKAPSILKEGVRYLSYDGQYFYQYDHKNQTNISNALNVLISDYKSGTRKNSINNGNPYYLYYQYLPFRSQTIYSASDLNNFINNHPKIKGTKSKLINLGQVFKDAESQYGVNALLALSIAMNESWYGNSEIAQNKNNLFGLNAVDSSPGQSADSFATPKDCVIDFAKNWISRGYADPADWRYFGGFLGNKSRGANVKYASDPFWGEKAASFAYEIDKTLSGGNSNLRDTNSKQIGIAKSNNTVINKNGTLLYNVTNDTNQYGAYINTPFVISDLQQVTINGKKYYEIYPERNTAVGSGGTANKYHGNYNWNDRGYIEVNNISLINVFTPPVEVKYGINRYSTAVELSKSSFSTCETIVISNGYAIPDGLAATPIASYYNSPLLLVEKSSIPSDTQNEIKRLKAKNAIIIGGTGVVTQAVEKQLNSLGITKITRLGGANRYETSLQVAKYIDQNLYDVENVVIANGYGQADALSIAPVSGRDKMPILLVETNNIPSNVYNWLRDEALNNAYIIGGTGVVSNNVLNKINSITNQNISGNRLGGADRYETNAKVIERFYGNVVDKVYITEGLNLADALTTGPVASVNNSPIVLSGNSLTSTQKSVLKSKTTNKIIQVGGVVSKDAVNNLKELLSRTQ